MKKSYFKVSILAISLLLSNCYDKNAFSPTGYEGMSPEEVAKEIPVSELTTDQLMVQAYVKQVPVIAHRGTRDYAPEETEAAYRYARYVGADYLQIDLQVTKDDKLVVFKGNLSTSNSNIQDVFPGFNNVTVRSLTLEELRKIDVGTTFNSKLSSTYRREGFKGLGIITLEEVINICEGKLLNGDPDPADLGNRPGLYIRIYDSDDTPGSVPKLKEELTKLGWYNDNMDNLKEIPTTIDKVDVANTKGRVILATQERVSLATIKSTFNGKLPTAFWLYYTRVDNTSATEYAEYINYGIDNGAHFICPNTSDTKSHDLLQVWHSNLIRRTHARIQGYVVDTKANMAKYTFNELSEGDGNDYQLDYDITDGFITDRPDYALFFYGEYYLGEKRTPKPPSASSSTRNVVFTNLGYEK